MRGLRRSWLSREVLSLSLFAMAGAAFAASLPMHDAGRPWIGLATLALGLLGVTCSARIYQVRARPAWFSSYTTAEFFATALLLGPLFVRLISAAGVPWVAWMAAAGAALQLAVQMLKFIWLSQSEIFELRASSLLLSRRLRGWFLLRLSLLLAAGILAPLSQQTVAAFALAWAGELLGRWLFFVSVVPKSMGAAFADMRKVSL
jgi:DMSO reductase anchor subunit